MKKYLYILSFLFAMLVGRSVGYAYCTPVSGSNLTYISNFTTTAGVTNINNTTGFTAGGYVDYTAQSCSQYANTSINWSVTIVGGTAGIGIWVDWNNNGVFTDAGESVYNSSGTYQSTGTHTGSFTVPVGQAVGSYRMRVITDWNTSTPLSCTINGSARGEAEDYTISVIALGGYCTSNGGSCACTTDGITNVTFAGINNNTGIASGVGYVDYTPGTAANVTQSSSYNLSVSANTGGAYTQYQMAWIDWNQNGSFADAGESYILGTSTNCTCLSSSCPLSITVPAGATLGTTRMRVSSKYNAYALSCDVGYDGEVEDYKVIVATSCTPPTITGTTPGSRCGTGTVTLGATASAGTINWYAALTGGATLGTGISYTTPSISSTTTYYVDATTTCTSTPRTAVTATVNNVPAAAITPSPANAATGVLTTATLSWAAVAGATSYDVWFGTSSPGTFIGNQAGTTYSPAMASSTLYYWRIDAKNACGTTTGTVWSFTTATPVYCTNTNATNTVYFVNNFSTTGGTTNITNNGTGFSASGYGNFTAKTVTQAKGSSISFSVTGDGSGTYGFGIWVDWNQNGSFADAGEQMYMSSSYAVSATGSFTVPAGALTGNTRMRVVGDWLTTTPVACPGTAYSECEDYTFSVTGVGANTITTGTAIAGSPFCVGAAVSVPYTITGAFAGNTFTAQLSDAAGSFAAPTTIGTLVSNIAGTVVGTIPAGVASGTAYRIRVISSAPVAIGSDNTVNLIVTALPDPAGAISGTASVCQGQNSVTYSVGIIASASSYTWAYSGAGATLSCTSGCTGSITINFSGAATSGNLTVKGVNGCGNGTIATKAITVNPLPVITTQPGNQSVGLGANANFTVVTSAGTPTYQWQMSSDNATWVNVASGTPAGVTYTNPTTATLTANGTALVATYYYQCVVTAGGCSTTSNSATLAIVNACATGIVPPWTEGFEGLGTSVGVDIFPPCWSFVNVVAGGSEDPGTSNTNSSFEEPHAGSNYMYQQYYNTAWVFTPQFAMTAGQSYTFSFWMKNKSVTSPVDFLMDVAYGSTNTAAGMTHVLVSSVNCNNAAWQLFTYTFAPAATGTYYFGIKSTSTTFTPWFLCFDDFNMTTSCTPPTITGTTPGSRCGTGTVSLSATASAGILNWYAAATGGASLGTGSPWTTPSIAATTTYYVDANNAGCITPTRTAVIATLNTLPAAAGAITGTTPVCQGQNGVVYSVGAITGATAYTWAYSGAGFSIASGSGTTSITANFAAGATSGNLTVMGTNGACSGTIATYAIVVSPTPSASGVITGTAAICQGQTAVAYSVAAIANATSYTWAYTGTGFSIVSGTGSNSITANFTGSATTGNLTVYGTNSCGTGAVSAIYTITLSAVTTPVAGPDQYLCTGTVSTTMAATALGGAIWTKISGPAGGTITTNNSATTTITALVSGTYVFRWSSGGCGSAYDDVVIVVQ